MPEPLEAIRALFRAVIDWAEEDERAWRRIARDPALAQDTRDMATFRSGVARGLALRLRPLEDKLSEFADGADGGP